MASPPTHNTLISLREYVDIRFEAQEKAVNAALAAADRAVNKSEVASDKRFESVNEFRSALNDSARLLMPRAEAEQRIAALDNAISELKRKSNEQDAKRFGMSQGWLILVAGGSFIVTVLMIFYYASRVHP